MTCFGAGIAVGLVVPDVVKAVSADESQDADEEFIARFTKEYDLTSEQVGLLSMILASREEEEMRQFSSFGHQNLPPALQRRLERVNTRRPCLRSVVLAPSTRGSGTNQPGSLW